MKGSQKRNDLPTPIATTNSRGSQQSSSSPRASPTGLFGALGLSKSNCSGNSNSSKSNTNNHAVLWARVLFLLCLAGCAAVLIYFAQNIIANSEHQLAVSHFQSISERALYTAKEITHRKLLGTKSLATIVEHRFPDASQWPFVALDGYEDIASQIIDTSMGRGMGFCPLVKLDQLQEFEDFAYNYYEENYPNNPQAGLSSFGKGVFGMSKTINTTDRRYRDTTGIPPYPTNYTQLLAPLIQHYSGANVNILMLNARVDPRRGKAIDDMMKCFQDQNPQAQIFSTSSSNSSNLTSMSALPDTNTEYNCSVISNFQYLTSSDVEPGAYIFKPISPAKQRHLVRNTLC